MKRVSYVKKGPVVVLKNSDAVSLTLGRVRFRDLRWVLSADMFQKLQRQNQEVTFVKRAK